MMDFFTFFHLFSSSYILKYFNFVDSSSFRKSSILNLLIWDNSEWISNDAEKSFFVLHLKKGIYFQLKGYRIRSSNKYFPKSWEVIGIRIDNETRLIHEVKSESFLCSQYAEKTYFVDNFPYYCGLRIQQTGPNSHGTDHFSLSAIEFFGSLSTKSLKDENLQ